MKKVFIDGSAGTTGLRIFDRLEKRKDIELLRIPDELRKDESVKKEIINSADIVFLCLPDDAARQSVALVENNTTRVIDTSTAHRTDKNFVYGFPELTGKRREILSSRFVANPGCHASGFIALITPLIESGVLSTKAELSCFSVTGYSGGGKKMIAEYESENISPLLKAPRQYGIAQEHKHLKEMKAICTLGTVPLFSPIVADFYSGMEVTIPLFAKDIKANIKDIKNIYKNYYTGNIVRFNEEADEEGFLSAAAFSGRDDMELSVFGNDERIILVSRYDNLGKGASGAAIQNMNIMLGANETDGLVI